MQTCRTEIPKRNTELYFQKPKRKLCYQFPRDYFAQNKKVRQLAKLDYIFDFGEQRDALNWLRSQKNNWTKKGKFQVLLEILLEFYSVHRTKLVDGIFRGLFSLELMVENVI